jgi:hypothetical protein
MIRSRNSFTALTVFLLASTLPVHAQSEQEHGPGVIKIVRLNHIDAHNAAEAISEIGLPIRVASVDGNSIILRGPSEEIERVISQVIPAMDAPQAGADGDEQTHLIPLNVAPTGVLLNLLETATAGSRTRFAIDHQNRLLVVKATASALESIRKVVSQLDQVSPSLSVEFYFIRGSIGPPKQQDQDALPKSLASVKTALHEAGLTDLTLLAPLVVRTDSREKFRSKGIKERQANEFQQLHFFVTGIARLQPDGKIVQLDLSAELSGGYKMARETTEPIVGQTDFQLTTTITARLGDYVVLAASPSTTSDGDAVALAVRVTTD